jgi:hypothetical protein
MKPITHEQLQLIKSSRLEAEHIFKMLKIPGWPRVVTTEPGKHFLAW